MYVVQSVSVRKVTVYGGVETNEYVHMVYLGTPMRQLQVYLYTTGSFKRRVILKQQFNIEKGYYDPVYNTPYSEPDGFESIYYRAQLFDCSKLLNHTQWSRRQMRKCATFGVWVEAFGTELFIE